MESEDKRLKTVPQYRSYLQTGIPPDEFRNPFQRQPYFISNTQQNVSAVREQMVRSIQQYVWVRNRDNFDFGDEGEKTRYILPQYSNATYLLALQDVFGYTREETEVYDAQFKDRSSLLWSYTVGPQQTSVTTLRASGQLETTLWMEKTPSMLMNIISCPALNWDSIESEQVLSVVQKAWRHTDRNVVVLCCVHSADASDYRMQVKQFEYKRKKYITPLQCLDSTMKKVASEAAGTEPVFVSFGQEKHLSYPESQALVVDIQKLYNGVTTVESEYRRYVDAAVGFDYVAIAEAIRSTKLYILAQQLACNSFSNPQQFVRSVQRVSRMTKPDDEEEQLLRLMQRTQIDSSAVTRWPVDGFFAKNPGPKIPKRFTENVQTDDNIIMYVCVNLRKIVQNNAYHGTLTSALL